MTKYLFSERRSPKPACEVAGPFDSPNMVMKLKLLSEARRVALFSSTAVGPQQRAHLFFFRFGSSFGGHCPGCPEVMTSYATGGHFKELRSCPAISSQEFGHISKSPLDLTINDFKALSIV